MAQTPFLGYSQASGYSKRMKKSDFYSPKLPIKQRQNVLRRSVMIVTSA